MFFVNPNPIFSLHCRLLLTASPCARIYACARSFRTLALTILQREIANVMRDYCTAARSVPSMLATASDNGVASTSTATPAAAMPLGALLPETMRVVSQASANSGNASTIDAAEQLVERLAQRFVASLRAAERRSSPLAVANDGDSSLLSSTPAAAGAGREGADEDEVLPCSSCILVAHSLSLVDDRFRMNQMGVRFVCAVISLFITDSFLIPLPKNIFSTPKR